MTRYITKQNANALREWMWIMALTAKEVSQALNICESTVHQLRRAVVAPTLETAINLHEASNGYVNLWNWQNNMYKYKSRKRALSLVAHKPSEEEKSKKRKRFGLRRPKSLSRNIKDI